METQINTRIDGSKLSLLIRKTRGSPQLLEKYGVSKYDLHPDYEFPDSVQDMIPSGTPEYITPPGKDYIKQMIRALYYFKQCALIGPSGTGKTHVVYFIAELTGLPIWEVNCGLQTSSYDLFGRYIGLGKENWIDGQIISWCRVGGILYLDEANMMKQDIAARLNPILDTRGHIVLTEKDNEVVKRHQSGYVIISMNPFSSEFVGTKPLNAAFRRRRQRIHERSETDQGKKSHRRRHRHQNCPCRGGVAKTVPNRRSSIRALSWRPHQLGRPNRRRQPAHTGG
jgi:nitric oxide reductase NorQ protein